MNWKEIQNKSAIYKDFLIAEIRDAKPHPNATKLQVCSVDYGGQEEIQIVCGAPNARKGIKVVLAPIGVEIPANNMKIKQSKIRDVESYGMLCSASELLIGEDSDGIMELSEAANVGESFASHFGLDDVIF